jgi:MerR family transcriptional regulator, light-induced transcriptional regulator
MKNTKTPLYHPVSLNRDYLAGKMLEKFAAVHPKPWRDFSMERRVQVREAFLSAIQSLEESLAAGSPAFLLDHAGWAQARFAALRFPPDFTVAFFRIFKEVLLVELPQDYRKAAGTFAGKAVSALRSTAGGKGPSPETRFDLSPAARSLLKALLAGDRGRGMAVIDKALAADTPVREIYTGIFQPVLWETGRLWQQDRATIAQEHYVSSEIRLMMDQLHDRIAAAGGTNRRQKKVVASCAGEELHEIGIRMVADFFEMDGWDVYCTGANIPAKSIISAVKDQQPMVLTLSITMPSRLPDLHYLIRSLRADKDTAQVKIIVGGFPFSILPDLWKKVGADAVAFEAEDTVATANRLTEG